MSEATAALQELQIGSLPDHLGFRWTEAGPGRVEGRLAVQPHHLAPNGRLHAASVVALADTACGFGCRLSLPEGASGFTTAELKANFMGTVRDGVVSCTATLVHGGRTTQVWDAEVRSEASGRTIALFRCTQIVLRPDVPAGG